MQQNQKIQQNEKVQQNKKINYGSRKEQMFFLGLCPKLWVGGGQES